MVKDDFLKILWSYPMYSTIKRKKLDGYFEVLKEDALRGDAFATYASYIVNIVCYRNDFSITIEQMDEIISGYNYPRVHAERLSYELRELLDL